MQTASRMAFEAKDWNSRVSREQATAIAAIIPTQNPCALIILGAAVRDDGEDGNAGCVATFWRLQNSTRCLITVTGVMMRIEGSASLSGDTFSKRRPSAASCSSRVPSVRLARQQI